VCTRRTSATPPRLAFGANTRLSVSAATTEATTTEATVAATSVTLAGTSASIAFAFAFACSVLASSAGA
jgi:hypothetical protein